LAEDPVNVDVIVIVRRRRLVNIMVGGVGKEVEV